jgi:hypothetical protein
MGWLVFFLLVVVGIVWAILAAIRRREALENYFREQGFRSRGSELPASPHFSREVRICFSRVGLVWRLLVLA